MRVMRLVMAGCFLLAGCGSRPATEKAAKNSVTVATPTDPVVKTPIAVPTDAWIGKWVGVEGLALEVAPGAGPGTYRLHLVLMDGASDYAATADGEVIRFTREGKPETIRHTSGAETGLKWLDTKIDCLTIKRGEGFCRD